MSGKNGKSPLHLGFLTAVSYEEKGHVGGLLITNHQGRPLEFQCTTPVRPNHTQEILYGPTLVPFILGELLGQTLLDRISIKADLLLIDCPEMLCLATEISQPVALFSTSTKLEPGLVPSQIGQHSCWLHPNHHSDERRIQEAAKHLPRAADLLEPFERVREALSEALNLKVA